MRITAIAIMLALMTTVSVAQSTDEDWRHRDERFTVTSSTFANETLMPLSTINNIVANNVNACSVSGAPGGNQSPELLWDGAPPHTRSFTVVAYDETAGFTHWGMYNIPGRASGLPENAGMAGRHRGKQVLNDFGTAGYGGPCPPANVPPDVHHYVFTVYALDVDLTVPGSTNFPANAEALYHALINAGRHHHILATASITGLYSSTPSGQ
jgi:Raf kinase inhibitor-like YbhB/YbcL family protein